MEKVFISYRRDDGQGHADHLAKKMLEVKPDWQVFIDREIRVGEDWREAVGKQLKEADLVVVLISPSWVAREYDWAERPLDSVKDWVRREVAFALEKRKPITPLLIGGACMPPPEQLPTDIAKLANRQAEV